MRSSIPVRGPQESQDLSIFAENLSLPRHRWYDFKEGFSERFVRQALDQVASRRRRVRVLDPFVGSGTTMVTAGRAGAAATGIELNPFLAFAASAKCIPNSWKKKSFIE